MVTEIAKDKISEIFCIIDEFCQEYDKEIIRMSICELDGRKHRNRKWTMSRSEIMTIFICFHFNTFRNFKHYYLFYVKTLCILAGCCHGTIHAHVLRRFYRFHGIT